MINLARCAGIHLLYDWVGLWHCHTNAANRNCQTMSSGAPDRESPLDFHIAMCVNYISD